MSTEFSLCITIQKILHQKSQCIKRILDEFKESQRAIMGKLIDSKILYLVSLNQFVHIIQLPSLQVLCGQNFLSLLVQKGFYHATGCVERALDEFKESKKAIVEKLIDGYWLDLVFGTVESICS